MLLSGQDRLRIISGDEGISGQCETQSRDSNAWGEERYLTFASTDSRSPWWGTLYVRGLSASRTHKPLPDDPDPGGRFRSSVQKGRCGFGNIAAQEGVSFLVGVPEDQAGGDMRGKSRFRSMGIRPERKFDIRAYRAPRLTTQIKSSATATDPGRSRRRRGMSREPKGGSGRGESDLVGRVDDGKRSAVRRRSTTRETAQPIACLRNSAEKGRCAHHWMTASQWKRRERRFPFCCRRSICRCIGRGELNAGLPTRLLEASSCTQPRSGG